MPTPNTVAIGDGITQYYESPTIKQIMSADWLLQQEFYVDADWDDDHYIPYHIELIMCVRDMYNHAGEEIYIVLAKVDQNKKDPDKAIIWKTEKQLEAEVKKEMKYACTNFSDDFLPCAVKLLLRAQNIAKKLIEKEVKKRKLALEGK